MKFPDFFLDLRNTMSNIIANRNFLLTWSCTAIIWLKDILLRFWWSVCSKKNMTTHISFQQSSLLSSNYWIDHFLCKARPVIDSLSQCFCTSVGVIGNETDFSSSNDNLDSYLTLLLSRCWIWCAILFVKVLEMLEMSLRVRDGDDLGWCW